MKRIQMEEGDITQWDQSDEDEHIPPGTVRIRSVDISADEGREDQAELFQRFSRDVRGNSNYNPKGSYSEDSDDRMAPLDLDRNGEVQAMTGNGFYMVPASDVPNRDVPVQRVLRTLFVHSEPQMESFRSGCQKWTRT
jgi:hypothetical protein